MGKFAGLADHQVLPRGPEGASVFATGGEGAGAGEVFADISGPEGPVPGWEAKPVGTAGGGEWRAELNGLPAGGPYTVRLTAGQDLTVEAGDVYVGDLWVLAGQSNMEGYGDLADLETPEVGVHSFGMDDRWRLAEEPLHWLHDSVDPVHYEPYGGGDPAAIAEFHRSRAKGAGLGLAFAKARKASTDVPIGLIPCAQGGTTLPQWSPEKRDEGGGSLYGAMLRRIRAVGGPIAGVLWYQGESDALGKETHLYRDRFHHFVGELRRDLDRPDLPLHTVQIGRFVMPDGWDVSGEEEWNPMQDLQRRLALEIPFVYAVPAVDLELDDLIHVGAQGLRRLGRRLARSVEKGLAGTPHLRSVAFEGEGRRRLRVSFGGVEPPGFPVTRRVLGFSIHDLERRERPFIYKARVDPERRNDILLDLIEELPEGWRLWYGHGLDPGCTLCDPADMTIPVFGPVSP